MPALTNLPYSPLLDLAPWVGQRQATFKFLVTNSVTKQNMGEITPLRTASLTHDTSRTTKRQLKLGLGRADTAAINPVQDRIRPYMLIGGAEYPLGTYMFTADTEAIFTSGNLGDVTLADEMFLVDQQTPAAVGRSKDEGVMLAVTDLINRTLAGLPINYHIEASGFTSDQSWAIGTNRGAMLNDQAVAGDWFSPWFDNNNVFRFIRTFDPATRIPDIDWDNGNSVLRDGITKTNNLLTVADKYIVTGNATTSATDSLGVPLENDTPIVGTYNVPSSYPYSAMNRGFSVVEVTNMPVYSPVQAAAAARALSIRNGVYETLNISTAPDPRHDSYNVIRWNKQLWLELSWSLDMLEGSQMQHVLRRAYTGGIN